MIRCLTHSHISSSPSPWGWLRGAEGHEVECFLASHWISPSNFTNTHSSYSVLLPIFCNYNRIFSFFIPALFSFPNFFFLSLFPLIGKENRQEINISFVGLMNQCLCSVLLHGLLIYFSLNSLKLPFMSLIVIMILFGTVNEISRKKFECSESNEIFSSSHQWILSS